MKIIAKNSSLIFNRAKFYTIESEEFIYTEKGIKWILTSINVPIGTTIYYKLVSVDGEHNGETIRMYFWPGVGNPTPMAEKYKTTLTVGDTEIYVADENLTAIGLYPTNDDTWNKRFKLIVTTTIDIQTS